MQRIAILYDASQAVLSTFDLDEVLRQILSIISDYFQLRHNAVFLLDARTNELCERSRSGWPSDIPPLRLKLGQGLIGCAAQLKRPIHSPNVAREPRHLETIPGTKSELAIPLMVRDRVVGVLDCQSHVENCFDDQTIDLLTLFSTQASIALQNAQLYELERRRAAQLEAINLIARQTTAVHDLDELLRAFCTRLLQAFACDQVCVLLLEDERLVLRAHEGRLALRVQQGETVPTSGRLAGRTLELQAPVLTNDFQAETDFLPGIVEARSELCLPLVSFGRSLGVLSLSSAESGAFRDFDLQPLESVADICAGGIQNAIYLEQVRQLAYRDGLTAIFNRRFFEMRILEELERARRHVLALSLLLIDVDGFKRLNDEFGHLLGDEALRQISALICQQVRKPDVVCRYGGDEFAVLLPETTGPNALVAAEKLRRKVASFEIPGVARPVSISVGAASAPVNGQTRDELVKAADQALYRAKEAGRNCVTLAAVAGLAAK